MAYFNPRPVTFNPDTMTIEASGAVGKTLYQAFKDYQEKNYNNRVLAQKITNDEANLLQKQNEHKYNMFDKDRKFGFDVNEAQRDQGNKDRGYGVDVFKANTDATYKQNQNAIGWANNAVNRQNADTTAQRLGFDMDKYNKDNLKDYATLYTNIKAMQNISPELIKASGFDDDKFNSLDDKLKPLYLEQFKDIIGNNPVSQAQLFDQREASTIAKQNEQEAIFNDFVYSPEKIEAYNKKFGGDIIADLNSNDEKVVRNATANILGANKKGGIIDGSLNLKQMSAKIAQDNADLATAGVHLLSLIENFSDDYAGDWGLAAPFNAVGGFFGVDDKDETKYRAENEMYNSVIDRALKSGKLKANQASLDATKPRYGMAIEQRYIQNMGIHLKHLYSSYENTMKEGENLGYDMKEMKNTIDTVFEPARKEYKKRFGVDPLGIKDDSKTSGFTSFGPSSTNQAQKAQPIKRGGSSIEAPPNITLPRSYFGF